MPIDLNPNVASVAAVQEVSGSYDYDYPDDLDIRPGQKTHEDLKTLVLKKARGSQEVLKRRFSGWNEIDKTLTAYIESDASEEDVNDEDYRKPTTMVVPVSYATIETLLTYMTAAFLEEPIFRYDGVGPEDVLGAILMEIVIAQQCRRAKVALELHTMWRDSFAYGFGAAHVGYENRTAFRTIRRPETEFSMLANAEVSTGRIVTTREQRVVFSGSTLTAIDPYMCLPDPDVPIHDVQKGEFFGWIERTNLMTLLSLERDNPDDYFNCRYLKQVSGTSIYNQKASSAREERIGGTVDTDSLDITRPVDVIHMYVKLIPKEYGLGDSEYPEKWLVSVAGDSVVIKAKQLGLDHDQFPVVVMSPDYDGHSITPISRLETVYELQKTIDWLFRSHIANVRKSINDMLVVDPQLVNIFDLKNPKPGKLIRLRRQAWGRGVKDAVMQLGVADVTKGHIQDASYITQIIRETTGAVDSISGIRRHTSERVSAAEATQTSRGALSRLEKAAKIASIQAHYDIAWQMAFNTRQLMESETYAKIIGDWGTVLANDFGMPGVRGRIAVSPSSLDIDFDVIPHDGTIPHSGDPQMWIQLFQVIANNPLLAQELDLVRIFKYGARMAGAKNLDDFVRKGQGVQQNISVVPDEQVMQQVQAGNLQPMV
jgi:hypothetical protein